MVAVGLLAWVLVSAVLAVLVGGAVRVAESSGFSEPAMATPAEGATALPYLAQAGRGL